MDMGRFGVMSPFARLPRPTDPSSPLLRGGAGDGEVDGALVVVVGGVDVDVDLPVRARLGQFGDELAHVLDRVVVLVEPVDVPVDHRGRDGDVDPVAPRLPMIFVRPRARDDPRGRSC